MTHHIDGQEIPSFPPQDWAPATSDEAWDEDLDGSMRLSAIAILAMLGWLIGIGMGWLIWS